MQTYIVLTDFPGLNMPETVISAMSPADALREIEGRFQASRITVERKSDHLVFSCPGGQTGRVFLRVAGDVGIAYFKRLLESGVTRQALAA